MPRAKATTSAISSNNKNNNKNNKNNNKNNKTMTATAISRTTASSTAAATVTTSMTTTLITSTPTTITDTDYYNWLRIPSRPQSHVQSIKCLCSYSNTAVVTLEHSYMLLKPKNLS